MTASKQRAMWTFMTSSRGRRLWKHRVWTRINMHTSPRVCRTHGEVARWTCLPSDAEAVSYSRVLWQPSLAPRFITTPPFCQTLTIPLPSTHQLWPGPQLLTQAQTHWFNAWTSKKHERTDEAQDSHSQSIAREVCESSERSGTLYRPNSSKSSKITRGF